MIEGLGKYAVGKAVAALVAVTGIVVIIWYWRLPADARAALWAAVWSALIWIGCVAVLPWATFFIPARVARVESNAASAVMLAGYLVTDIALAIYLAGGFGTSSIQRLLLILGFLCAAVYNFVVCERLAQRVEDSP